MDYSDNLSKYKIFLTAAECKSISAAAKRLYISQPAVSSAIKRLEENLGVTLFIRKPRGIELTESGHILYEGVRGALGALSDTEALLRGGRSGGRLRIGASSVLCKNILMPYLSEFTRLYPDEDVSITCVSSAYACAMLEDGAIDLALAARPSDLKRFTYHSLGGIEDIFVCTPSYPERIGSETGDIFSRGNIMLLNKDNATRRYVDAYFEANNITPSHILEVNDMTTLTELAKTGIGVSCVVRQFVLHELENGLLCEIPLKKSVPKREIGFLYNETIKPVNKNILRFISLSPSAPLRTPP